MFEIDWRTPHLWAQISKEPVRARPALTGEHHADVAIIGGGYTGLSTALSLAEAGLRTIVIEANAIGSAASGRNNGLVIPHHSKGSPTEIRSALGPVHGPRYNDLVRDAARDAFTLIRERQIRCDAVDRGWIQPAHSPEALARVRTVFEQWRAEGAAVEWLDPDAVGERVGSRYLGGWQASNGGHVNPFALAQGLARAAEAAGARIVEGSRVTTLRRDERIWRLGTADGSVEAEQVFLATNALTDKIWPGLAQTLIPVQIYQAATAPVPDDLRRRILAANPAVSDTRRDLRAFHYDADGRIVTGGTLMTWRGRPRLRAEAAVRRMLAQAFPLLGPEPVIEHYWEGVFAAVPDRLPRLMRLAPGLTFGGVYSGRGVAASLSLGRRIGAWLAERSTDDAMPLPVTDLRRVPFHPVAVQVARRIHSLHRWQDRRSLAAQPSSQRTPS